MDISISERDEITACEVLYLADKLLRGERLLPLAERFRYKLERYAGDPVILDKVSARLKTAQSIQKRIEFKLGRSLEEVLTG